MKLMMRMIEDKADNADTDDGDDDGFFSRNTFQPSAKVLDCEEILNWI